MKTRKINEKDLKKIYEWGFIQQKQKGMASKLRDDPTRNKSKRDEMSIKMKVKTITASNDVTQLRVGVNREFNWSRSLRCVFHSCDSSSCPPACGVMKDAHRLVRAEGARWGGWARRTVVRVAVVVPSPPPGGLYRAWQDSKQGDTWCHHARSGQPPSGPEYFWPTGQPIQLSSQRERSICG